jgi:hypothetical protein
MCFYVLSEHDYDLRWPPALNMSMSHMALIGAVDSR